MPKNPMSSTAMLLLVTDFLTGLIGNYTHTIAYHNPAMASLRPLIACFCIEWKLGYPIILKNVIDVVNVFINYSLEISAKYSSEIFEIRFLSWDSGPNIL